MARPERRLGRIRRDGRIVLTGAATVMVAAAVLAPLSSALAAPRAAGSGNGASWAPVTFRHAQLSVPGRWLVESPQQLWCGSPSRGMVFAGIKPRFPKPAECHLTANLAWILPAGHTGPASGQHAPAQMINGIRVYRLPSGSGMVRYLVPRLGVRVGARGPLAHRVLATLTRSPLSVVLRRRSATAIAAAAWTWHRFGGVRFATPARWNVAHASRWATCGTGLDPRTLLLTDATRPPLALPCPFLIPTAAALRAQPGLTVVTGKYATKSIEQSFKRCVRRDGSRLCLSTETGQGGLFGSVLIFSVTRQGSHHPVYFILGLPGSGTRARIIFDSVTPVRR